MICLGDHPSRPIPFPAAEAFVDVLRKSVKVPASLADPLPSTRPAAV